MRAFEDLSPEQREARRRLFRRFTSLPDGRRPVVRREFERLRELSEEDRRVRFDSEEFRHRFSLEERHLLREMADVASEGADPSEPRP